MKYLFSLIIISMNCINAMEKPKDEIDRLEKTRNQIKKITQQVITIEATTKKHFTNIQNSLSEMITKLPGRKPNQIQNQELKESFFTSRNIVLMLGLTSISFIAGYLMGSKSLKFMSPR